MAEGERTCLLFVYGSLKRGQANHSALRGAQFLALAHTVRAFALREIAGYPALVPGREAIAGELYQLPLALVPELDEFEGDAYVRGAIELLGGGTAITYLARTPEAGTPLTAREWPAPPAG